MATIEYTEVEKLLSALERYWATWRDLATREDQLFEQLLPLSAIPVPPGIPVHVPSTASSVVTHVRDQIRIDTPVVDVEARGTSLAAHGRAALQARFGQELLERSLQDNDIPAPAQNVFDLVLRGMAVVKLLWDESEAPSPPEREDGESEEDFLGRVRDWRAERSWHTPLSFRAVDPLSVYLAPTRTFPVPFAVEKQERLAVEVRSQYPDWNDPNRPSEVTADDLTRKSTWVEYWSPTAYCVFADGQEVISKPNPFGFVPFVMGFSGLGRWDSGGDPSKAAVGILRHAYSELLAEARLKTMMDASWQFSIFPRLLTPDAPKQARADYDIRAGSIWHVKDMTDAGRPRWMEMPTVSPGMYTFLPQIQMAIERATYVRSLEGERPSGVEYGYLQALLIGQARQRIAPIVASCELLWARVLRLAARAYKKFGYTVTVFGTLTGVDKTEKPRLVTPDDLDYDTPFKIRFEATNPADNDQRELTGLHLLRAGAISKYTYLKEYRKMKDPLEEIAIAQAERVVDQLIAQGFLAAEVSQLLQQADQDAKLTEDRAGLLDAAKTAVERVGVPGQPGRVAEPEFPEAGVDTADNTLQRLAPGTRGPMRSPREGRPLR